MLWKDGTWVKTNLERNANPKAATVRAISIKDEELVSIGSSYYNDTRINVAGYWMGDTTVQLPPYSQIENSEAQTITFSGTDTFVGGYVDPGEAQKPTYWVNSTLHYLSVPHEPNPLDDFAVTKIVVKEKSP